MAESKTKVTITKRHEVTLTGADIIRLLQVDIDLFDARPPKNAVVTFVDDDGHEVECYGGVDGVKVTWETREEG